MCLHIVFLIVDSSALFLYASVFNPQFKISSLSSILPHSLSPLSLPLLLPSSSPLFPPPSPTPHCLFCLSLHSGADAIIRQHKAACLRITALLACKDLLWIGTSAGKNIPKYIKRDGFTEVAFSFPHKRHSPANSITKVIMDMSYLVFIFAMVELGNFVPAPLRNSSKFVTNTTV